MMNSNYKRSPAYSNMLGQMGCDMGRIGATTQIQTNYPQWGFYLDNDGTYYLSDGTPLLGVDLSTGEYQEQDGTWYDQNGNPEDGSSPNTNPPYANGDQGGNVVTNGPVVNSGNPTTIAVTTTPSALQSVATTLSNLFNPNKTTVTAPAATPAATTTTTSSFLTLPNVLIFGALGFVGYKLYKNSKKKRR
jgi:hypothetical protein